MPSANRITRAPGSDFRRRLRTELPRLLREDAGLRAELQEALKDLFPARAEVAELRALREDFHRFAAEVVRRFETMDQRFTDLRQGMERRFEAVDRRLEAIDRRFEAVDRRFEALIAEMRTQSLHLSRLS